MKKKTTMMTGTFLSTISALIKIFSGEKEREECIRLHQLKKTIKFSKLF